MVTAIIKNLVTKGPKDASKKVFQEGEKKLVDDFLNKSQEIIDQYNKGEIKELTPRANLLDKKTVATVKVKSNAETQVKPDIQVKEGEQAVTTIKKEDFKVKQPKPVDAAADDVLQNRFGKMMDNSIGTKILDDFNINKINNEKDIADYIQAISKKFAKDINVQKRGVQTQEATKRLATMLNKNPDDLTATLLNLTPGKTLNSEYIFAARELLVAGMSKLDDLAIAASKGGTDNIIAFRQHFALMSQLQKVIKGVQTETARALQQFRIPTRQKQYTHVELDKLHNESLLLELGDDAANKNLAKLYLQDKDATRALSFVEGAGVFKNISKASDAIAEIYIQSFLSNPFTHIKNTAGNWLTQGITALERNYASAKYGGVHIDGVAEFEGIAKLYGKHQASIEASAAIARALEGKNVFQKPKAFLEGLESVQNPVGGSKIETNQAFTGENFNFSKDGFAAKATDITGRILTLDRIPTRMLGAADNYFKSLEYRSEIYAQAFRETIKQLKLGTLTMEKAEAYMADAVLNPSKDAAKAAHDAALYVTHQTKLQNKEDFISKLGEWAQTGKQKSGWFSWLANYYLPFTQTPTNIATFVAERTPGMNFLLKSFRDDLTSGVPARVQMAKAKFNLGLQFYLATAPLGALGYNYGSGPDLRLKGKQQIKDAVGYKDKTFQIGIGNTVYQINYNGLDPFSTMFAQSADLGRLGVDVMRNPTEWEHYANFTSGMILSFGENLVNSTFMVGGNKLIDDVQSLKYAIENEKKLDWAKKWAKNVAAPLVPIVGTSGAKEIGRLLPGTDSYKKITQEFDEIIKKDFYDNELYRDFNIRGEPIGRYGYITKREQADNVDKELERVSPSFSPFDKFISVNVGPQNLKTNLSIPLQSDELSYLKYVSGKLADGEFKKLVETPEYKNAPVLLQKEMFETVVTNARQLAKDNLKQDASFAERITARATELYLNKLKEEQLRANDNFNNNN